MKPSELVPELAPYDGDWRKMRDEVGLIVLHTRLGNRFTSFYETAGAPTAVETETAESITTIWVETTHVTVTVPTYTTVTVYSPTRTITSGVTTVWTTIWTLADKATTTVTVEVTKLKCEANTVTVTETVSQDSTTWVTDTRTVTGTATTWVTPTSWTTATITITPTTTTYTTTTIYGYTVTDTTIYTSTYEFTSTTLSIETPTVEITIRAKYYEVGGGNFSTHSNVTTCPAGKRPQSLAHQYDNTPPQEGYALNCISFIPLGIIAMLALPDRLYRLARRNAWKIAAALVIIALASVYIMPGGESVVSPSDMTITTTYTNTFYTPTTTTTTVCCATITVPSTITYTDYKGYLITTYAGTTTTVPQVTVYKTKTTYTSDAYECSGKTQDVTVTTTKYVGNVITSTTTTTVTVGETLTLTVPSTVIYTTTTTVTGTSTLTSTMTATTLSVTSTKTITSTCEITTREYEAFIVYCTVTKKNLVCDVEIGLCNWAPPGIPLPIYEVNCDSIPKGQEFYQETTTTCHGPYGVTG
jgi:hypothetical protein